MQAPDGCDRRRRARFLYFSWELCEDMWQLPLRSLVTGRNRFPVDQLRVWPLLWLVGQSLTALSDLVCYVTLLTWTGGLGGTWSLCSELVLLPKDCGDWVSPSA